jgi:hypothetical protein
LALYEPEQSEKPVRINGIDVIVAEEALDLADGRLLDYASSRYGGGFTWGEDGC